jgi:hypothetical protein
MSKEYYVRYIIWAADLHLLLPLNTGDVLTFLNTIPYEKNFQRFSNENTLCRMREWHKEVYVVHLYTYALTKSLTPDAKLAIPYDAYIQLTEILKKSPQLNIRHSWYKIPISRESCWCVLL